MALQSITDGNPFGAIHILRNALTGGGWGVAIELRNVTEGEEGLSEVLCYTKV